MKYTIEYAKVERIRYEFDEGDIRRALIQHLKGNIKHNVDKGRWELDWIENDGTLTVLLNHIFEEEMPSEESE